MTKKIRRLDLLLKEVTDPVAQENFWRLKRLYDDGTLGGTGSTGAAGAQGPAGAPGVTPTTFPALVETFDTDAGTAVLDLVRLNGTNSVTKITDNTTGTIPQGVFGLVYYKPSAIVAEVIFMGILNGFLGLTPGSGYYISATGTLTTTPLRREWFNV